MAINIGVTTGNSAALLQQLQAQIQATGGAVGDFLRQSTAMNAANNVTTHSIESMIDPVTRLTQRFRDVNGVMTLVSSNITQVAKATDDAANRINGSGARISVTFSQIVRAVEIQLIRRAMANFVSAVREGIDTAVEYSVKLQQVFNVSGISGNANQFGARLRELSDQFGVGIVEVLKASQTALTSQLGNTAAGFDVLTAAMKFSQATGIELDSSTKLLTATMQAFRLTNNQAADTTNTFYLAAQRSRVSIDEMQSAIGRAGRSANDLGITMQELTALFLTIEQRGGKPVEALSMLAQLMGKFREPSKEMQNVLNDLGTPTIQLAINTFGLVGFLERLNEAATRTPERLSEIAGNVRTLNTLTALGASGLRDYEQQLRAISNNRDQVGAGQRAVAATPAQQLANEVNQLKNVFSADWSSSLLNGLATVTQALGGAKVVFDDLVRAAIAVGGVFAAFKAGSFITEIRSATFAVSGLSGALGIAAIAVGALWLYYRHEQEQFVASIERAVSAAKELGRINLEQNNTNANARIREARNFVTGAYSDRLQALADQRATASETADIEINNHRRVAASFRVASQEYIDLLHKNLTETRQTAHQTASEIIASQRSIELFGERSQGQFFQHALGIEQDPTVGLRLIEARRRDLAQQMQAIYANPIHDTARTPEEIARSTTQLQAARGIMEEINRLGGEQYQREHQLQLLRAQQTGDYRYEIRNGELVRVVYVDLVALQQRQNALVRQHTELETQLQARLARRAELEQQSIASQRIQLVTVESLLRQIEQFRPLDDQGRFTGAYAGAERRQPGAGATAALADFDRIRDQAVAAARSTGATPESITLITNVIENQRQAILRNLGARQQLADIDANTERTNANRARDEQDYTAALERRRTLTNQLIEQGNAARVQRAEQITRLGGTAPDQVTNAVAFTDAQRNIISNYRQMIAALNAAQEAQNRFNAANGQTPENLQAIASAMDRARTAAAGLTNISTAQATALGLQSIFNLDRGGSTSAYSQGIQQFLQQTAPGANPARDQATQLQNLDTIINSIRARIGAEAGLAPNLQQAAGGLSAFAISITTLNQSMPGVIANFRTIAGLIPGAPPPVPGAAGGLARGGMAGYAATGALAGYGFPGGPRGTDTLPYWLTKGEFIINADSTRKFYSQLVSINSGVQPKYAAKGGPVSIGDIHISVNGGSTSEKTIREIGRGLQREMKRGTITLN